MSLLVKHLKNHKKLSTPAQPSSPCEYPWGVARKLRAVALASSRSAEWWACNSHLPTLRAKQKQTEVGRGWKEAAGRKRFFKMEHTTGRHQCLNQKQKPHLKKHQRQGNDKHKNMQKEPNNPPSGLIWGITICQWIFWRKSPCNYRKTHPL